MKFIYSNGGYAREFFRILRDEFPSEKIVFIDDAANENAVSYKKALELKGVKRCGIIVGFADGDLRKHKTEQAISDGFDPISITAETSVIGDNVELAEGAVISDFSIVTADAKIGKGFQCNIYSYVAHDCVVGDFVTLAPRVSINGRVQIEDNVYVGTGAIVLPGKAGKPLKIGKGAVIGAHALVVRDVEPGTTVVGTPARPLEKK